MISVAVCDGFALLRRQRRACLMCLTACSDLWCCPFGRPCCLASFRFVSSASVKAAGAFSSAAPALISSHDRTCSQVVIRRRTVYLVLPCMHKTSRNSGSDLGSTLKRYKIAHQGIKSSIHQYARRSGGIKSDLSVN